MEPTPHRLFSFNNVIRAIIAGAGIVPVIFFVPFFGISLDLAKMSLFSFLVVVSVIVWAVARLKEGTITIPRSFPTLMMAGVIGVTVLSALLSGSFKASFFGAGYETTTAIAIILLGVFFFLAGTSFRTPRQVSALYGWFIAIMVVLGVYEAIRLIFGPGVLSFGIFGNALANPVGKWNDLGLLFGLSGTLSLLSLVSFSPRGKLRLSLIVSYAISLAALFIANFPLAWGLFAFSSVSILGFSLMTKDKAPAPESGNMSTRAPYRLPLFPLMSAVIAIVFLLPGNHIADVVGGRLGLSNIEVRPSWGATVTVAKESVRNNPLLGIGPNRFARAWLMHKPDGVNDTLFWNTEFEQGIGVIPSLPVTVGIFGALIWILFLASFVRVGIRAVFAPRSEVGTGSILFGSFLSAVYLFIAMISYVPGAALIILAFLFGGATLGMIARENPADEKRYAFAENPRIGFISVLLLVVILIVSSVCVYTFVQRFVGMSYLGSGAQSLAAGDIETAEAKLSRADAFFPHDSTERVRTEAAIGRMRTVLSGDTANTEAFRTSFQNALGNAVAIAKSAISYDETNYQNWITLGRVYESIVPLKIEGAYENARAAYEKAITLNPTSPAMYLTLARLEAAHGDLKSTREYLEKAIGMKNNYTEAIFALSQLEAQEGNIKKAIEETERAALIAPNDIGIFFQLGFLRYSARDYAGAISALERTVALNPVYANAKYFLGLSYAKTGRMSDAVRQFEDIETLNPENAEVKSVLANLRDGKDPFAAVVPPEKPPEKREKPPIEE